MWLIPVSEARDLNDSAKPLEWRYSRIDLWLEAACSEAKRGEQRLIWPTDLLFVCLRGETLLVVIKGEASSLLGRRRRRRRCR